MREDHRREAEQAGQQRGDLLADRVGEHADGDERDDAAVVVVTGTTARTERPSVPLRGLGDRPALRRGRERADEALADQARVRVRVADAVGAHDRDEVDVRDPAHALGERLQRRRSGRCCAAPRRASGSAATCARRSASGRARRCSVRSRATSTVISAPAATVTATTVSWRTSSRPARLRTRIGACSHATTTTPSTNTTTTTTGRFAAVASRSSRHSGRG